MLSATNITCSLENSNHDRFSYTDATKITSNSEYDIVFGRATGVRNTEAKTLTVFFTPEEDVTDEIPYPLIFPLPQNIITQMQHVKTMEKLVSVPVDGLVEQLMNEVSISTNTFLANQNVDVNIITKCADKQINLFDLNVLKRTAANLLRLIREPPTDFYQQLADISRSRVLNFKVLPAVVCLHSNSKIGTFSHKHGLHANEG